MGELGTDPASLERSLQEVFSLCTPWRALVLIDEAEMLLERRTKDSIIRNAMVCVMLRLLEYFPGVLFLTSNRVDALDPAFQSRVQCALRYDDLDEVSRGKIWTNLLVAARVDPQHLNIAKLSSVPLNGRQIKNSLQLGLALAKRDGVSLTQAQLEETVAIASDFSVDVEPAGGEGGERMRLLASQPTEERCSCACRGPAACIVS